MTFWGQGAPEEALMFSCPPRHRSRWAPLDRQPHWRLLIFLLAKGFRLFKGRSLPGCLPLARDVAAGTGDALQSRAVFKDKG